MKNLRFTSEDVKFLQSQVGKKVKLRSTYANGVREVEIEVRNVSILRLAAGFSTKNGHYSNITKRVVETAKQTGVFDINCRRWNYSKGQLTYPGPEAVEKAVAWEKENGI